MATAIRRSPLISFFVLAYLLSWAVWTPLVFLDLAEESTTVVMLVGVLGPMAGRSSWRGSPAPAGSSGAPH